MISAWIAADLILSQSFYLSIYLAIIVVLQKATSRKVKNDFDEELLKVFDPFYVLFSSVREGGETEPSSSD